MGWSRPSTRNVTAALAAIVTGAGCAEKTLIPFDRGADATVASDSDASLWDAEAVDAQAVDAQDVQEEPCLGATGWVGMASTPGSFAASGRTGGDMYIPPEMAESTAWLPIAPDRVEATTVDGRTVACDFGARASYECKDDAGLTEVAAYVGEQRGTADDPFHGSRGDCRVVWADGPIPLFNALVIKFRQLMCVDPETVVVQGALRGYAPELPPDVWLVGEALPRESESEPANWPVRPCEVEADHYRCTTLGYHTSATHKVLLVQGKRISTKSILLEVDDCTAQPVELDFDNPDAGDASVPSTPIDAGVTDV